MNPLQLDFRVVGFLEHENRDKAGLTLSHLPNRLQAPWPRLAALTGLWHIPVHVLCKYLIYLDKSEDSESRSPSQTFNSPSSSRHSHAPRGVCRAPQPHAPAGGGATEPPPSAPHRQARPAQTARLVRRCGHRGWVRRHYLRSTDRTPWICVGPVRHKISRVAFCLSTRYSAYSQQLPIRGSANNTAMYEFGKQTANFPHRPPNFVTSLGHTFGEWHPDRLRKGAVRKGQ